MLDSLYKAKSDMTYNFIIPHTKESSKGWSYFLLRILSFSLQPIGFTLINEK